MKFVTRLALAALFVVAVSVSSFAQETGLLYGGINGHSHYCALNIDSVNCPSATAAAAQTPAVTPAPAPKAKSDFTFPGSVWSANGTLSPAEKGNVVSLSHAEQGVMYKGYAEVFVASTLGIDSKGFDWNNKTQNGVGVRLTQSIKTGMVRVSAQYVRENRWVTNTVVTGPVLSVDSYFSWGR